MAMKIKMLKLLSERRGYSQVTNRRPTANPPVLFLMKLREQSSKNAPQKRRLTVEMTDHEHLHTPLPVKINHIKSDGVMLPSGFPGF